VSLVFAVQVRPTVPTMDRVAATLPTVSLTVSALASEVAFARRELLRTLISWDMTGIADTAMLLLSEVLANAILHADGGRAPARDLHIVLEESAGRSVYVEVHDPVGEFAIEEAASVRHHNPNDLDESGRGLFLVDALARQWGIKQEPGGMYVYFIVTADDPLEGS